jgi:hypothetical protein
MVRNFQFGARKESLLYTGGRREFTSFYGSKAAEKWRTNSQRRKRKQ